MVTTYNRRFWIIIPADKKAEVNAGLNLLGYGSANFPLGLVPVAGDDDADVTKWCSYWQMNAAQRTNFMNLCVAYPLIRYDELDESTRELLGTNRDGSALELGTVMTLDAHLAHHELKRRVVAIGDE